MFVEQFDGLGTVGGFGHHFHVRLVVDDRNHAHADDVVVVRDQDSDFRLLSSCFRCRAAKVGRPFVGRPEFQPGRGACARRAGDLNVPAQSFGPFPDAQQSKMAVLWAGTGFRVKSLSVVLDLQDDLLRAELQFRLSPICAGMFDDIGDGFLADAQQVFLDDFGQWTSLAHRFNFDADAGVIGICRPLVRSALARLNSPPTGCASPRRTGAIHLALPHQVPRQFQMLCRRRSGFFPN